MLFILGAGHCGSTLLSLLLNGHPTCISVSELASLSTSIAERDPVLDRDEWRTVARCFEQRSGTRFADVDLAHPSWREFGRWPRETIIEWATPRSTLLRCLLNKTEREWVVDASKSWQQLYLMQRSELFDLRVLHLVRDGHGVVHSYTKKYGQLRHGLSKWIKSSVAAMSLASRFQDRWLRVRYEDLSIDPATTLMAICRFMNIAYDSRMLQFRSHTWLGLGGNRMSKRKDDTIRLDERWRREMSRRDRLVVDLVGGMINRYHGY